MMAATMGESQLQRIIRDLQDAVTELNKEFKEMGEPITDDSSNLHKFFYKLEYLLQFDMKEKSTLLGNKKDYWDYFCDCLAKVKGANDGIRFVKSISELKTSLGKGRAFLRYSLVHQRLADTLQQCLMNSRVTSDWYFARSPFLTPKISSDIVGYLYELTEVQFDLASRGFDLDASWPTFARRTLTSPGSSAFMWKAPSRSSSMSSLVSNYLQAQEFAASAEANTTVESLESLDDMRIELDQTELKLKELENHAQQLEKENQNLHNSLQLQTEQLKLEKEANHRITSENAHLTKLVEELQKQCEVSQSTQNIVQELQKCVQTLELNETEREKIKPTGMVETFTKDYLSQLETLFQELEKHKQLVSTKDVLINELQRKLNSTEVQGSTNEKPTLVCITENNKSDLCHEEIENIDTKVLKDEFMVFMTSLEESFEEAMQCKDNLLKTFTFIEGTSAEYDIITSEQLNLLKEQFSQMTQSFCSNEKGKNKLVREAKRFTKAVGYMHEQISRQTIEIGDLFKMNSNLKLENEELKQAVIELEHKNIDLQSCKTSTEADLIKLSTSNKQGTDQTEDSHLPFVERENKLLKENKKLDENLQNARVQYGNMEENYEVLENDYKELQSCEKEATNKLTFLQTDLEKAKLQISQLEKNINVFEEKENMLVTALEENNFDVKGQQLLVLANNIDECVKHSQVILDSNIEQTTLCQQGPESVMSEKSSVDESHFGKNSNQVVRLNEIAHSMSVAEKQIELGIREIKRLQAEVVNMKGNLRQVAKDRDQAQGKLEITQTLLNENQILVEQLKKQVEHLNFQHVEEITEFKERERQLLETQEEIVKQKSDLEENVTCMREELIQVKDCVQMTSLDYTDTKDELQRNNTEMAELGIQICTLTSKKKMLEDSLTQLKNKLQESECQAAQDKGQLQADLASAQQHNKELLKKLKEYEQCTGNMAALKTELENVQLELKLLKESSQEELSTTKFQMSAEILNYEEKFKAANEELEKVKQEIRCQKEMCCELNKEVTMLQDFHSQLSSQLERKTIDCTEFESIISKQEENVKMLNEALTRKETELEDVKKQFEECNGKLDNITKENENNEQKFLANIDDLNRTKQYLEERLIELIRDKDALWQKSDALEFEQKIRASERWIRDTEVNQCLDCRKQFNWMLRRHHCRLCGHIFCYYCCNNYVMTKHSDKKERCCRNCYRENHINNSSGSEESRAASNTETRGVTVTEESKQDTVFDIITDEELNQVQECASSHIEADLLGQCTAEMNSSSNSLIEDSEDIQMSQDNEIYLLTTGELM
ncbi:FYVE and coiled-coil domain-containing protein 1 [Bombina bombina]|uniref:FYVE and coiled-coil domain-containing protein 1 n=1 Tax=Bombina bombina TaxID=8345 RepID=UPI00235A6361|nr:FYVE and coiled-coil domain-containing protein 1 [Bombina bombina]